MSTPDCTAEREAVRAAEIAADAAEEAHLQATLALDAAYEARAEADRALQECESGGSVAAPTRATFDREAFRKDIAAVIKRHIPDR